MDARGQLQSARADLLQTSEDLAQARTLAARESRERHEELRASEMEAQLGLRDALRAHEEVQRTLLTERHDHADLKRQYEHWRQAHEDSLRAIQNESARVEEDRRKALERTEL